MRILGIDPGSRVTGFGVVQVLRNGRIEYIASGCVRVPPGELAARLKTVYGGGGESPRRARLRHLPRAPCRGPAIVPTATLGAARNEVALVIGRLQGVLS